MDITPTDTRLERELEYDARIAQRLRYYRRKAGYTLADFGETLGITHQQVQKYETRRSKIPASRLAILAEDLGLPVTVLVDEHALPNAAYLDSTAASPMAMISGLPPKWQDLLINLMTILYAASPDRDLIIRTEIARQDRSHGGE